MRWAHRFAILVAICLTFSFVAWFVPRALDPSKRDPEKRARDRLWINTSPHFLDRQACQWFSICGIHHLRRDPAIRSEAPEWDDDEEWGELRRRVSSWADGTETTTKRSIGQKRGTSERTREVKEVPDYVLNHAPLVHLYSKEEFWPSDIREHVEHMAVYSDGELVKESVLSLHSLSQLNDYGKQVHLRSKDNVEDRPDWLYSHHNLPNPSQPHPEDEVPPRIVGDGQGKVIERDDTTWFDADKDHPVHRITEPRQNRQRPRHEHPEKQAKGHKPDADGYSKAPAVLVMVDKGSGIVDAFWFFFYSYNLGQTVLGVRYGNHVGDWEHCLVRFEHGEPRGIFFSEHEGGQAYAWDAVEKLGSRPVIYSAVGSHAMYPLPGIHPYVLPFKMLKDVTDKGPLWDPALNNYAYHYDYTLDQVHRDDHTKDSSQTEANGVPQSLVPAASNPDAPTSWFYYRGRWGDEVYSLADHRQWRLFGQYHYVTGPDGPRFKTLNRRKICQSQTKCKILRELDPKGTWY